MRTVSVLLITLSEYDTRGSRWREKSLVAVSEWVGMGHFDRDGADKGGNYGEAGLPVMGILVVCTANRCRSVMAEALLARRLACAGGSRFRAFCWAAQGRRSSAP